MSATATREAIETSRQVLLREIGHPRDLTLVSTASDRGEELSYAGALELVADRIYREASLEDLCQASGDTVLLCGGAFTRPVAEILPRVLAVAGLRFERVIVMPTRFDPSEDRVRDALLRSPAIVFASEEESYRRIAPLCQAQLAHDCAFFFDLSPYDHPGQGTLEAFSSDHHERELPPGNEDISLTAPDLDTWITRIAEHEVIRTDRAEVRIAAEKLGRQVEFTVAPLKRPASPPSAKPRQDTPRVTALVLTRDRPRPALQAIDSITASDVLTATVVIDNNSGPEAAAVLEASLSERDGVELQRSDRNLGCAGGRRAGVAAARTELVLMLDDDAELVPGALELLVSDLDAHPEAAAVTATVVLDDGGIHHSGGWMAIEERAVRFGLVGAGEAPGELPPTGTAGWVPGTAVLIRRSVLEEFPIDEGMRSYFEDNEWCYRVERARPGSFRRSVEARAIHHFDRRHGPGVDFVSRSTAVELLSAHARFYERHGRLLDLALFDLVPELRDEHGRPDPAAARLLMELLLAKGGDWMFMSWMNGDLDPLIARAARMAGLRAENAEQARQIAETDRILAQHQKQFAFLFERHATLQRVEAGGWWRLRGRLLPVLELAKRLRRRGR